MRKKLAAFYDQKPGTVWQFIMGGIMVLFICIMIAVYLIARQANPIILDEKGKPLHSQSDSHNY